jgi:group I intron endonuclease
MNKGIYKIRNLINGKVYIGQSEKLTHRKWSHFYSLDRGKHYNEYLQKSYNKYGKENFVFEVIEETEDLDNREIFWINEHGGINSILNYNLRNPLTNEWCDYIKVQQSKKMLGENNPNFGNRWSEEQKKRLSDKKRGKTLEELIGFERAKLSKEKMSKSQKGRKHPKEVKEKIRKANIGEKNPAYGKGYRQMGEKNHMWGKPQKNRKPIRQFTKDGELVNEFEYLSQVKNLGYNPSNVMTCANKKSKSSYGYIWEWK